MWMETFSSCGSVVLDGCQERPGRWPGRAHALHAYGPAHAESQDHDHRPPATHGCAIRNLHKSTYTNSWNLLTVTVTATRADDYSHADLAVTGHSHGSSLNTLASGHAVRHP